MTNESYIGIPLYNKEYDIARANGNEFAKVNLTTTLISNTSLDCIYCNSMLISMSEYWVNNIN